MVTDVRSERREPPIRRYRVVFQRTWILNNNAISDSVQMSKPVTHRAPVILIYVTALFRMRVVAVGNYALFVSKDLDDMTVWDDMLHVRCCSKNVAFWVHSYLTEGNIIMCISDVIYYYYIINIQWIQQPFKRGMKPLEHQGHSLHPSMQCRGQK